MLVQKFRELFGDKEKEGKISAFIKKAISAGMGIVLGLNIAGLSQGIGGLSEIFIPKVAYAQTIQQKQPHIFQLLSQWASLTFEHKGKVIQIANDNVSFSSFPDGRTGVNFYLKNGKVLFLPFGESSFYDLSTKKIYTPNTIEAKELTNILRSVIQQINTLEKEKMHSIYSTPEKENFEKEKMYSIYNVSEKEKMHPVYNIPEKLYVYNKEDFKNWVEYLTKQFDDKKAVYVFTKHEFEEFLNKYKPSHITDELKLKNNFTLLAFSDKIGPFKAPVNVVIVNDAKKNVFTADELAKEISEGIYKNSDTLLPYMENKKSVINQTKDALSSWRNVNNTARETLNQIGNSVNVIEGIKRIFGR
ncbi:MAG: hypothetical protein QXP52_03345 [Candidatus Aenigmatarchaeota archaeon]